MADHNELARDLATLGRLVDPPSSPDRVVTAVMERIAALPLPGHAETWWSRGPRRLARSFSDAARRLEPRRRIALVVAAVLLALLATPPVRAAVAEWFGFAGMVVERGTPEEGPAAPPPSVAAGGSPSELAGEVGFALWTPTALGEPDGVEVSADRRVVSMTWSSAEGGTVRLDQFDARLDFSIAKRTPDVTYASVDGVDALWFASPHDVVLLERDGTSRVESARLAGQTLVWPVASTTMRLEGNLDLSRALEIAESVEPLP